MCNKKSLTLSHFYYYQTQGLCCPLSVGVVSRTDTVYVRLFMGLGSVEQLIGYL